MKNNKTMILVLSLLLVLANFSFIFAEDNKPIELNKDNPERIVDFIIEEIIIGTVNINYLDTEGNNLIPSESFEVDKGKHTYKAKEIDGYVLESDSLITVNIIKNKEEINIDFFYKEIIIPFEPIEPSVPIEIKPVIKDKSIVKEKPAKILGAIRGYMTFEDGTPIKNAKLELHSLIKTTHTDNKGYFEFKDVELGNHKLYLADDKYTKDLLLLESLTVYADDNIINEFNGLDFKDGILDTAQIDLTENSTDKEVLLIVKLGVEETKLGSVIVNYVFDGNIIKKVSMDNLELKSHTITPKEIKDYILISKDPKVVILTEDDLNQVVEFKLDKVKEKEKLSPLLLLPLLLILFLYFRKKHIGIYAIDNEIVTLIKKKRIKTNSEIINISIDKEVATRPNIESYKVVIYKNIARKLANKQVNILYKGNIIKSDFVSQSINQDFTLLVEINNGVLAD